ncbi:MAG: hypothetical protein ABIA92_05350 [Patescibacteria group bacterium]
MSLFKPSEAFERLGRGMGFVGRGTETLITSDNRIAEISRDVKQSVFDVLWSPVEFVGKSALLFGKKITTLLGIGALNAKAFPVR